MAKDVATRAPRGTKILAQAFFSAADEIPDDRRDAVVKAALALIRDQLKDARDKSKVVKEKIKARGAKAPAKRKVAGRPKTTAKTSKRPGRKPATTPPAQPMDEVAGF
jgi:hypothetical protein